VSQSDDGRPNYPEALNALAVFTTLVDDADLVAVLRGHLYIEAMLTEIIATKYAGAAPVVRWLDFWRKVRIARENKLIESEDAAALQVLGNVRDSFAHLPIKVDMTAADDDAMHKTMKSQPLLERYETFSGMMIPPESTRPGRKVRAAIGALYDVMTVRYIRAQPR
jgi:hypothetical protein